jgi:hypothetical protein
VSSYGQLELHCVIELCTSKSSLIWSKILSLYDSTGIPKINTNKADTYTNQSTANRRETSSTGASIVDNTMNIRTRAALGTLADEKLATVDAKLYRNNKFVP